MDKPDSDRLAKENQKEKYIPGKGWAKQVNAVIKAYLANELPKAAARTVAWDRDLRLKLQEEAANGASQLPTNP